MRNPRSRGHEAGRPRAVILTAIRVEYEAIRSQLTNLREHSHEHGTVYEIGDFTASSGFVWQVCLAEIGPGNAGAAQETERALAFFDPQLAMFVGVAGGVNDVNPGDVVVATKVYAYESGKVGSDFQTRPEVCNSAYDLVQRARAEARANDWAERVKPSVPHVYVGPIASGEKVVASRRSHLYRFVRKSYGDALAVEMEGSGFLVAARSHPNVHAVVVRGISDLIFGKAKADDSGSQLQAARNASAFACAVLDKYLPNPAIVTNPVKFEQNTEIENLIKSVKLGDWEASTDAAIQLIQRTSDYGSNPLFNALLKYHDCPDEDLRWAAFQVIRSTVGLSPNLIDRYTLTYLANHPDFSVRASAASICMDLAEIAPALVPIDLLIPLSVYNEDWYVQAPPNAALKILARSMPRVLEYLQIVCVVLTLWNVSMQHMR